MSETIDCFFDVKDDDLRALIGVNVADTDVEVLTLTTDPLTSTFYLAVWISEDDGKDMGGCGGSMLDGYSLVIRLPVTGFFERARAMTVLQESAAMPPS